MPAGRPPKKDLHVQHLDGGEEQKQRLQVILKTLSGELSVVEACQQLGISEARFHVLRKQTLQAALDALEPGAPGRPPESPPPDPRVTQLEEENKELKIELQAARVRTEIAVAMPHLLKDTLEADVKKKKRLRRLPKR